ncbi:tetratricopeptide repeat protein [Lentzea sp. NBRC 102530]|uniref:tetratricopeptide repeat protein n=1 Tax=Lentzea sp. NBRC 102530 TaxID=3032201 RepID=UPI0024A4867E|nr:tetratricopeptide repeat protein [Lentzea sp. NBRC 102530]GLY47275.1 hypothetical protein Lesp01_09310 [Lentzea sp. NBRC 102530]
MVFGRKKRRAKTTTDHVTGDYGSAEISYTERPGDIPLIDVKVSMTPEYAYGLDLKNKLDTLGPHHVETHRASHLYAVEIATKPERLAEAVELLEWVADHCDDEEVRLPALNDLTRLLQDNGHPKTAEPRLREALSGWERLRGQNDDQTLKIATNLAHVLMDLGRPDEAEGLMRDTVARRIRAFGLAHAETLRSMNSLAGTLRGTPARLAEAESLYRQILSTPDAASDRLLGVARSNLAAVLLHQGQAAEALEIFGQLITDSTRQLGSDHKDTWTARLNHAAVLARVGRLEESERRLVEVLAGYRRVYGPGHHATLDVQVDLAATKANQGRQAEAIPLLRDAIAGLRNTHGQDHPKVRRLQHVLAELEGQIR